MSNYLIMVYGFSHWTWIYDFKNKKWDKFNWCNKNANEKFIEVVKTHHTLFFNATEMEEAYTKFDEYELEYMGFENPNWKDFVKVVSYVC